MIEEITLLHSDIIRCSNLGSMDYKCSKCKQIKPHRDFYERKPTSDDSRPVRYECTQCQTNRDRRKETYARALKRFDGEVCSNCRWPNKLYVFGMCRQCVKTIGYRVCRKCDTPKLSLLFPANKMTCNSCLEVNDSVVG